MSTRTLLVLTLFSCFGLLRCSDGDGGEGGLGGAAGQGGASTAGGGSQCDASSATCECIELAPGGLRACKQPPVEATTCPNGKGLLDQCCTSAECAAGACYGEPLAPICSGIPPGHHNVCGVDECADDAGCPDGTFCLPAGVLGYKIAACVSGCRRDSDCTEKPGGRCVIEPTTSCCHDDYVRCRYPDTPPLGDECPP